MYTYDDVKWEIYPRGKRLKLMDVINELNSVYVPEDRKAVNQQKIIMGSKIEERDRADVIWQKYKKYQDEKTEK